MPRISRLLARRGGAAIELQLEDGTTIPLVAEAAAGLRVGQVLSAEALDALRADDAYRRALGDALRFLGYRPRSQAELERRMEEREVAPALAERVLRRLAALGLVDDGAFARWWVAARLRRGPVGRQALRHGLRGKAVPEAAIEAALDGLDDDAATRRAALARAPRYRGLDRSAFERRLGGYLARRGFRSEAIRSALAEAWRVLENGDA